VFLSPALGPWSNTLDADSATNAYIPEAVHGNEIRMKTIFFAPMRLAPPPEKRRPPLLKMLWELTWLQWAFFVVGWLAWTCDALDFFSVSVSVPALGKQFNKPTSTIVRTPFHCRQQLT
jgi:hypothetical protein